MQSIHQKYIGKDEGKIGILLQALALLRPALLGQGRLEYWWKLVVRPTLEAIGRRKDEIECASSFVLGILVYDADDAKDVKSAQLSDHFARILLRLYLDRTRIQGDDANATTAEDEYVARQFEDILVAFGQKKSKVCSVALSRAVSELSVCRI